MDERILKFRVGIFVVISMLILGILILTISGKPFFGSSYQISGQTQDASGISSGTPIKKFGLPIGRVTKVVPSPNGKGVTVWMSIQETDSNGLKQTIDTSAEMAVIGSESILGDVVINIEPLKTEENNDQARSPTTILITKSNPIEAVLGEQGSSLMSGLDNLLNPDSDVKTNLGSAIAKIGPAADAITDMFAPKPSTGENPPNLASAIQKLNKTSENIKETSNSINDMFKLKKDNPNFAETISNFNNLLGENEPRPKITFRSTLSSIEQTSGIARETFSAYEKIPAKWDGEVKGQVVELIGNVSQTVKAARKTVKRFKPEGGSLVKEALSNQKMGTDFNTINESLAGLALKVESLAEKVNEDEIESVKAKLTLFVDDLRFFGDSIARNPGSIVRGALRPRNDIGPKSSPTVTWNEDGYFQE